jgi:hypothetical protein
MKPLKRFDGKKLQVVLPPGTAAKLKHAAELREIGVSQVIREVLLKVFGP